MPSMKRTYAIVALASVLTGVESKIVRWANDKRDAGWRPAQATVAVQHLLHGFSPKPTNAPRAPDAAPDRSLDKRATTDTTANNDNTCAYISGIAASSLYCDPDNACVYNSIYSYIGCCPDASLSTSATTSASLSNSASTSASDPCPVYTTCLDSTQSASFKTDNGYTLYCGDSTYPTCIRHLYKDPVWTGYTLWGCARTQRTDFVYYTPTVLTSSSTSSSSTTSSDSDTSTATSASTTGSTSATQSAGSSTSTSPVPVTGGSKKSTPVGPIGGGVVGGVAALGLIGLALFFLLRKKKSGAAAPAAAATTTTTDPTAPGQAPPPPGGYYDPSQPQMAQQQGHYGYGAAAGGFAPVDPRASIAKPPYVVQQPQQQGEYNPAFSPPGSPAPAYNGAPGSTPPPGQYGQSVSPDNTGYGQQQQPYQATQYNQYQNAAPPQQAQPYGQQHPAAHPTQFAAELPTQRGDGEVRELAG